MLISASSTVYVHVPITGPDGVDLTDIPPRLAILPAADRSNPEIDDWHVGEWAAPTTARLLVGPDGGALTLTHGDYRVWVSFDPPGAENIVERAGHLGVT